MLGLGLELRLGLWLVLVLWLRVGLASGLSSFNSTLSVLTWELAEFVSCSCKPFPIGGTWKNPLALFWFRSQCCSQW